MMTDPNRRIAAVLAACCLSVLLSISAPVSARAEDDDHRLDMAWDAVAALQEGLISDKLRAMMNNMAYQAAVPQVCEGYALDVEKFSKGFSEIQESAGAEQKDEMSDGDLRAWHTAMAVKFGISVGVFLAEGHANPGDFCANASELRQNPEVPLYWE